MYELEMNIQGEKHLWTHINGKEEGVDEET